MLNREQARRLANQRHFELLIGMLHTRAKLRALVIGFRVGRSHPACRAAYVVELDRCLNEGGYLPTGPRLGN